MVLEDALRTWPGRCAGHGMPSVYQDGANALQQWPRTKRGCKIDTLARGVAASIGCRASGAENCELLTWRWDTPIRGVASVAGHVATRPSSSAKQILMQSADDMAQNRQAELDNSTADRIFLMSRWTSAVVTGWPDSQQAASADGTSRKETRPPRQS